MALDKCQTLSAVCTQELLHPICPHESDEVGDEISKSSLAILEAKHRHCALFSAFISNAEKQRYL